MIATNHLNVSQLSAISADLGTINAGTLNAVIINSGLIRSGDVSIEQGGALIAGAVRLDENGLNLATGWGWSSELNWDNGVKIFGAGGGQLFMHAPDEIVLNTSPGGSVVINPGALLGGGRDLGSSVNRWGNLWMDGEARFDGPIHWSAADSQNAGIGRPLVVAGDGIVHGVANGINGTYNGFTFENGICTGHP